MKPTQKKRSGQSLVEFAISVMVLMLILLGAVETAMAIFQYVTISDAAQEGSSYASVYPPQTAQDTADIKNRVKAATAPEVVLQDSDIFITVKGASCEGETTPGVPNSIEVKIIYNHNIIFPLFSNSPPIKLISQSTSTILTCP